MTRPTAKEIKAVADVAGVPVSGEVASEWPIPSVRLLKAFRPSRRHVAVRPGARDFLVVQLAKAPSERGTGIVVAQEVAQGDRAEAVLLARGHPILPEADRRWQPRLNAFMAIEAEAALRAADAADAALAKGKSAGALHGVPLAHKDMYYDAGHVVTCGSRIRRDFVAARTSTALQRLKDAGTIRLGSLQMAEFAYGPTGHNSHYGAVHNPWRSITSPAVHRRARARRSRPG